MSFTTEIKRELVKTIPERREARLALLQAVLKTCGERSENGFSFVSDNAVSYTHLTLPTKRIV